MHTISSYCGNRPTNTQTHRQDQLQYTAPQLVRSVKITSIDSFLQVTEDNLREALRDLGLLDWLNVPPVYYHKPLA